MRLVRTAPAWMIAAILTAGAAGAAGGDEPQRPRDVMNAAVDALAAQAQNARVKLSSDARGFGRGAARPVQDDDTDLTRGGRVDTGLRERARGNEIRPSQACCANNLANINRQMQIVGATFQEYLRRTPDPDEPAKAALADMAAHAREMDRLFELFAGTDSEEVARSAIKGFATELAKFKGAHESFVECCLDDVRKNRQ